MLHRRVVYIISNMNTLIRLPDHAGARDNINWCDPRILVRYEAIEP